MKTSILSQLRSDLPRLKAILDGHPSAGRTDHARRVCEAFDFRNANKQLQAGSCLSALRTLDKAQHIQLPAAQPRPNHSNARILSEPVPHPTEVPDHLGAMKGLRLDRVITPDDLVLWNTLIHDEHPIGVTKFAGHQKKYLISSDHGYLGAIGFSASALYLAARDQWMGWSEAQRQAHLQNVMGHDTPRSLPHKTPGLNVRPICRM